MNKKKKRYGLFDLVDQSFAVTLGVDVEVYVDVIEKRCTDEEMGKIVCPLLFSEDEAKMNKSMDLFYTKLTEDEMKTVKNGGSLDLYIGEVDMRNG